MPYYTHSSGKPQNQTRGQASEVRDELDSVSGSFALLPTPDALQSGRGNFAVDTGLANAYVITAGTAITAYADGQTFLIKAVNANTGASTLNVNGLGLKAIVRPDGTVLKANDIFPAQVMQVSYNAIAGNFQLQYTALAAAYAAETSQTAAANSATASANSASASAGSASAASTSATNSANSATASASSASSASTSATNSANSATASGTSATNSANSATAANTSATNAASSASSASTSASTATTQATTATTQATNASNSAAAAATSATNAGASETQSATNANTAYTAAVNAGNSATAASNSAAAANTSANNASTSAFNAATSATQAGATLTATSTTSQSVGLGAKSITIELNKSLAVGQPISVASTASPANADYGIVTAYTPSTGVLSYTATDISGSGTFAAWTVSVTGKSTLPGTAATALDGTELITVDQPLNTKKQSTIQKILDWILARANTWTSAQTFNGAVTSGAGVSVTGGTLGYGVGAGGSVTQATDKTTMVTLNKSCGLIIMANTALAAGATVGFAFNNTQLTSDNILNLMLRGVDASVYRLSWASTNVGVCAIYLTNQSTVSRSETVLLNFLVMANTTS